MSSFSQTSTSALGMHSVSSEFFGVVTDRAFDSHMGLTAIDASRGDIDKIISALGDSLQEARAAKENK